MNKLLSIVLLLGLVSIIYFSSGCKKEDTTVRYVMLVDSIQHADTINVGDVFEVRFYAKIGPNECFSFNPDNGFEAAFGPSNMQFKLYGTETQKSDCSGSEQYLNGGGVGLTDMTPGDWIITVLEPEGVNPIESTVYVRE